MVNDGKIFDDIFITETFLHSIENIYFLTIFYFLILYENFIVIERKRQPGTFFYHYWPRIQS